MPAAEAIVTLLQEALLQRMGEHVDLIYAYGSRVRGNTHAHSDVDLSWVPVQDDTWTSITVLVGGTLYDLYATPWSHLERLSEFRDPSASVLLHHRVLYQRTPESGARLAALAERLEAALRPDARPEMIRRAMEIVQGAGWDYYLLREAAGEGRAGSAATRRQALAILRRVLHALAVCNQACVDTRHIANVLALPAVPPGLERLAEGLLAPARPAEACAAADALLGATRRLLLAMEREVGRGPAGQGPGGDGDAYRRAFDAAYPELVRDLQCVLQGCDTGDRLALQGHVLSLQHEISRMIALAEEGIDYGAFSPLGDYGRDLTALGFPSLLEPLERGDLEGLRAACGPFGDRLRTWLAEQGVPLNAFEGAEDLRAWLERGDGQI